MKTAVSEATNLQLDWMVAKAKGLIDSGRVVIYAYRTYDAYGSPLGFNPPAEVYYCNDYRPTTDWSQGGPIIEREEIFLAKSILGGWTGSIYTYDERVRCTLHEGQTPLVAAMRCFVTAKLGDEVEVPEELDCQRETSL